MQAVAGFSVRCLRLRTYVRTYGPHPQWQAGPPSPMAMLTRTLVELIGMRIHVRVGFLARRLNKKVPRYLLTAVSKLLEYYCCTFLSGRATVPPVDLHLIMWC